MRASCHLLCFERVCPACAQLSDDKGDLGGQEGKKVVTASGVEVVMTPSSSVVTVSPVSAAPYPPVLATSKLTIPHAMIWQVIASTPMELEAPTDAAVFAANPQRT